MPFETDVLTKIQAAITAKLDGGAVEDYTLPDGTNVKTAPLEVLRSLEEFYRERASKTSRMTLARTRPW